MKTKITNATLVDLNLGFVPPHGIILKAGASQTIDGDLRTVLATGRGRYSRAQELAGFDAAEAALLIEVYDVIGASSSSEEMESEL